MLTNLKTLFVAVCALEYGEEAAAALLRLFGFNLPIVVGVKLYERRGSMLNVKYLTFSYLILAYLFCQEPGE